MAFIWGNYELSISFFNISGHSGSPQLKKHAVFESINGEAAISKLHMVLVIFLKLNTLFFI